MNPLLLLKGDTLGKTIYNTLAALAILAVLTAVGFGVITGKFWKWKAGRAEDRAENAEAVAETATTNAQNANGSAENASMTRGRMDGGTFEIRLTTDQAATRAENYDDSNDVRDASGLPVDLVRELESAEDRAGAAADRLQRKGSR